jgi:cytidylate kinase
MDDRFVITVGRQYGSGGRQISRKLAECLGVAYYDKELITQAARDSGMSEKLLDELDERATNSLHYSLVMGTYTIPNSLANIADLSLNDKLYQFQNKIIHDAAQRGSCVIVGRCADYVLREHPRLRSIFIHADLEIRKKRVVEEYGEPRQGVEQTLQRADKKRASYYDFYTGRRWGDATNYHLCVDSGILGVDNAVTLLEHWIHMSL